MLGDEIFAQDVADEIVVQATLRLMDPPTVDDAILPLTVLEFKQAIVAVLARYGARLSEDPDEHDIARLHDEGNPHHKESH